MIFVTGGTGFIGKYVIRKLIESQEEVIVLVRNAIDYFVQGSEYVVEGTLDNPELWKGKLKKLSIDTCIHLAWEGIPDYSYEMSKKNLLHGLAVLDVCKELGIQNLVITGSCWEYDNPRGSVSVSDPVSDANAFKASKNALRMMAHTFCQENQIHFNWLRLFYVYGPGQRAESLIPHIIKSFKEEKQPELNGAYNRNDFVYVLDVADAIVKVAGNHIYPEILNVGSGYSTQVLSIVKMVAEAMGQTIDEGKYLKSNHNVEFYADKQEMCRDFSWEAKITMKEGIKYVIDTK